MILQKLIYYILQKFKFHKYLVLINKNIFNGLKKKLKYLNILFKNKNE